MRAACCVLVALLLLQCKYFITAVVSCVVAGAGEQTLEVDVVVDALLAATRCFGEQRQQWARVLSWFEGLSVRSGGASFSFVAAMFSTAQKEALRAALLSAETSFAGDPACRDRANRVRLTYGLSNC